ELAKNDERVIIPVGTTSLRTLETLYWLGVKLLVNGEENFKAELLQWENLLLEKNGVFSTKNVFEALVNYCEKNQLKHFIARTQIMITPDYKVRTANAILTNFHQPESSLLLLIGAFVGDEWKTIYDYAMQNDFRFLSYGDSSLLWLLK
ncbi:MAG TPA: S-adenosylmethionine:tRNA ribosyltransferase-isomerase, partial [Chitinophagales bacterium]